LLACCQNGHDIALPVISTAVKLKPTIKSNPGFQSSRRPRFPLTGNALAVESVADLTAAIAQGNCRH
jgi:hypothetical protein